MTLEKDEEWLLPENLRRQEKREISLVEAGLDASSGDFGSYYALLRHGNKDWVRKHALIDPDPARIYSLQAARAMRALGPLLARPRLLDVGCGPGAVTEALARELDCSETLGVDISESAVTYARQRFPEIQFQAMAISEDTALPGKFDIVHAREFYPFTRTGDPDTHWAFLRMLSGNLEEGGFLALSLAGGPDSLDQNWRRLDPELAAIGLSPLRRLPIASRGLSLIPPPALAGLMTRILKSLLSLPISYFDLAQKGRRHG
jgi:SAM-dependent methyltransferase